MYHIRVTRHRPDVSKKKNIVQVPTEDSPSPYVVKSFTIWSCTFHALMAQFVLVLNGPINYFLLLKYSLYMFRLCNMHSTYWMRLGHHDREIIISNVNYWKFGLLSASRVWFNGHDRVRFQLPDTILLYDFEQFRYYIDFYLDI